MIKYYILLLALILPISVSASTWDSFKWDTDTWDSSSGYTISGTISSNGSGISDVTVTVTLNGTIVATTLTDGTGNYTVTGLVNGNYIITPSKQGYTFSAQSVTVNGSNITGDNFSGGGGGPTAVPVMEGWWLLPGMLAGVGIFARRRKE
jgi:hypothetical protein